VQLEPRTAPATINTWHDSDVTEFMELLSRHILRGHDSYLDQRVAQLVRRRVTQGEGTDQLCDRLDTAAEWLSRQHQSVPEDDEPAQLNFERKLRRASIDLCGRIVGAVTETSQQVVSALAAADHTLQQRVDALAAVQTINGAANSSLNLVQILQLTTRAVQKVTKSDLCSIYLFDETANDLILQASTGLNTGAIGVARLKIGEGITGSAASIGKPLAITDAWHDPRFKYIPEAGEEPYHSMLSVPVLLFTVPKLVGVLNVQMQHLREWTTEEISLLETIAGQIAMAIENARLYGQTDERLRRKVEEMTNLRRLSELVASSLDIGEVLDTVLIQVQDLSSADMAAIFEMDGDGEFRIVACRGLSEQYHDQVRVRYGEAIVGSAAKSREPIVIRDALADPRLTPLTDQIRTEGFRSLLCIPLVTKHGPVGGVCLYTREIHTFSTEEIDILTAFANEAAIALENARLYDEVRRGLKTKSTLLAELHHRVKNNLQTIAALLSMQQRRSSTSAERAAFAESVSRVQSIAAIHDLLSREDIGVTGVEDITRLVVTSATGALSTISVRVQIQSRAGHALIASREATVLALVLNELVTNSIVHGFEGRDSGRITLTIDRDADLIRICISDNGRGLPDGFDPEKHGGLGVQIVKTLVRNDLKGSYSLRMHDGQTLATIAFPGVTNASQV